MLHMVYIETEFSYLEKQKHEELKDTTQKSHSFAQRFPQKSMQKICYILHFVGVVARAGVNIISLYIMMMSFH